MTTVADSGLNSTGAYTDNLLLKMEKLVQTAVGDKFDQKRSNSESAEPLAHN